MKSPTIVALEQETEVTEAVAAALLEFTNRRIQETGNCIVALSGEVATCSLFEILGSERYLNQFDWEHIVFLWADEKYTPLGETDSQYTRAKEWLFSKVSDSVHVTEVPITAATVEIAAREYAVDVDAILQASGKQAADVVLLGLGDDGHMAGLYPKSEAMHIWNHRVAYVKEGYDRQYVTLSLPFLIASDALWFMVTGDRKMAALARVLRQAERYAEDSWQNRVGHTLPTAVLPMEKVTFFVDREAYPGR